MKTNWKLTPIFAIRTGTLNLCFEKNIYKYTLLVVVFGVVSRYFKKKLGNDIHISYSHTQTGLRNHSLTSTYPRSNFTTCIF